MHLDLAGGSQRVSALLERPAGAWLLYVMAHGAGAGMRHKFMESMAAALANRGVATLRYQFPYMEAGRKRPDGPEVAQETVGAAVDRAASIGPSCRSSPAGSPSVAG